MSRQSTRKQGKTSARRAVWILAADAGRARLFEAQQQNGGLTEIADLLNAEARLHEGDVVSDRAGHVNRGSDGVGSSFEPRQWHIDHAAETFAKSLCRRLGEGRRNGTVDRIYLLADPTFLGLIRKNLDRPTQRIVAEEKAIDLTRRTAKTIRGALPAIL